MRGGHAPETVRKAAALVEALDGLLDKYGARLGDGSQPIRFALIGTGDPGAEPLFEAIPVDDADRLVPTGLNVGIVR